jgi:hypothetical protein
VPPAFSGARRRFDLYSIASDQPASAYLQWHLAMQQAPILPLLRLSQTKKAAPRQGLPTATRQALRSPVVMVLLPFDFLSSRSSFPNLYD